MIKSTKSIQNIPLKEKEDLKEPTKKYLANLSIQLPNIKKNDSSLALKRKIIKLDTSKQYKCVIEQLNWGFKEKTQNLVELLGNTVKTNIINKIKENIEDHIKHGELKKAIDLCILTSNLNTDSTNFLYRIFYEYIKLGGFEDLKAAKELAKKMNILDNFYEICEFKVIPSFANIKKTENFFAFLSFDKKIKKIEQFLNEKHYKVVEILCLSDPMCSSIIFTLLIEMGKKKTLNKENKEILEKILSTEQKELMYGKATQINVKLEATEKGDKINVILS